MKKLFWCIGGVLAIGLVATAVIGSYWFVIWQYEGEKKNFEIEAGDTFGKVNAKLEKENLIVSARAFYYLARYENKMSKLNHGLFVLKPGMHLKEILETLCGPSSYPLVMIPEGKNLYEVAKILESAGIVHADKFIQAARSSELIEKTFDEKAKSTEGYLFPETYRFAPDSPAEVVIDEMIQQFHQQVKLLDFSHPFLSKAQVIILASIVEKETGAKSERKIIAGVFTNRLMKHMRLQSDPTTIYGIWEKFNGNLHKSDLLEKTPYNTYAIDGLPQGPISNPSLDAIQAVLSPAKHQYLYFVSRNDGTHVFSRTYAEHDRAVDFFQRTRANREGKSWRQLKQ